VRDGGHTPQCSAYRTTPTPFVVVDFNDEPGWVVTAMVQRNPPVGLSP
jgi:hypothetical protein